MGLIKNFIVAYDETLTEGVDQGTDPIDIITGDTGISLDPGIAQIVVDEITDALGLDSNKPLGIGFKGKYKVNVTDDVLGVTAPKDIDAEDYLTSQGFKYIYFPEDITEQGSAFGPKIVAQMKNMMASVNLIDINKTIGVQKDAEFYKGIQKLMEFSMNNGGQFTFMQGLKMLYNAALTQNAPVAEYTLSTEEMDDLADTYIASAEKKKGSPLTKNEKDYLTRQLNAKLTDFQGSLSGLQPASTARIEYDVATGQATTIPGQAAEQPDVEGLGEELSGVVEEFIAPREELARQAQIEEDSATRFARTMNSLSAAESEGVMR